MGKVEIKFSNKLITKNPRKDREPTVYARSIRRLFEDKKHPGKNIQVYANIEDDYKIFGIFTINTGGSVSFFPDFYNLNYFDHLTLSHNFLEKNGHLTFIDPNGKHKKFVHIEVNRLPTDDFHLITFAMTDGDLLMDSLPVINYPDIEYETEHKEQFYTMLQEALHNKPIMLDFPKEEGVYLIQILVIAKGKNIEDVSIALGFEEAFSFKKPIDKIINAKKAIIETPDNFNFSLCLICFKIKQELKSPFAFAMAQNLKTRLPTVFKKRDPNNEL
jgi:hypothetical protein